MTEPQASEWKEAFPIMDFIDEEMTARGWDASHLRDRCGSDDPVVLCECDLIDAMRPSRGFKDYADVRLSDASCEMMGRIFGTSEEYWKNLQAIYIEREARRIAGERAGVQSTGERGQ